MSFYLVILFACSKLVRVLQIDGWALYVVAFVPAIQVIASLAILGRYLQEETDEFLKTQAVRSLLVTSGALLGTILVNDFLRVIAHAAAFNPFSYLVIFFVTFGIVQIVQDLLSRVSDDE